ncbi:MFS transporter [Pseudomonas sp.]|uniref:MFS transporter n=1 Tax=Pseudomonas sp. TaxID=306 RepID=UPI00258AE479|nr:MFS transporter [Pseudomonas sp.]
MHGTLLYFIGAILVGDGLMNFLVPLVVYGLTGSLGYAGLAYLVSWLPRLVLMPLVGGAIDRWGVRPLSITADLIKCAACLGVLALIQGQAPGLVLTVGAGLLGSLISIGNAQTLLSCEKIIAARPQHLDRDANRLSRLDQGGMVLGPLLGMMLFTTGYTLLLALAASLYLANALFFLFYTGLPDTADKRLAGQPPAGHWRAALLIFMGSPLLWLMTLLAVGNNAFDGTIEASGAALVDRLMALPIQYYGLIDLCAGVCGVAATMLYARLIGRLGRHGLFAASLALALAASALLVAVMEALWAFLACYALGIAAKVMMGNYMRVMRISLIPQAHLASVSAMISLVNQSILPVVGLLIYWFDRQGWSIAGLLVASILLSALAGWRVLAQGRQVAPASGAAATG